MAPPMDTNSATLSLLPLDEETDPVELQGTGPFTIGRDPGSTLVLPDASVSRLHAAIMRGPEGFEIEDRSSTGGTWVDGVHLEKGDRAGLVDGTLVRVGPACFVVRDAAEVAAQSRETHVVPEAPAAKAAPARDGDDPYATRASIFLKLRADGTVERQLGWQEFHQRYAPVIAGFARNAGLSGGEIDDVVQDVMLGFFRRHEAFEYDPARGRFRGYLKRVTINAIRDRWRRRKNVQALSPEYDPPQEDPLDSQWEREWAESLLRRAMEEVREKVQPRTLQAFELYGVKGLPVEVVEKETGMSASAIRHAKMRILADLQACVKRYRDQEG
ncbi:MAG: sigma-70 family RNA polymerase sigma factor [Phycisphaerales bacterium]